LLRILAHTMNNWVAANLAKIKILFKSYSSSVYKKGFLYIFSSKLLIAFVGFLVTPLLSRLFTPAEYGYFALMNAMTMILALLSNMTLPTSLLATEDSFLPRVVSGILEYALVVNTFFLITGCGVVIFLSDFSPIRQSAIGVEAVVLMAVSSFLITLTQVLATLNIRNQEFRKNVVVNIAENFTTRILSLVAGFIGFTRYGLFSSDIIGKMTNVLIQFGYKKQEFISYWSSLSFTLDNFRVVIRKHRDYPLYSLPSYLIGNFSNQLILWILALSISSSSVGFFTMAVGLLNIPLQLLANSFQPLITSKFFNELKHSPHQLFVRLVSLLFVVSGSCYLVIYLGAPYFIRIYLGEAWLSSIPLTQILCVPFALQLLGNSVSGAFVVFDMQRANFTIKFVFLIALLVGFFAMAKDTVELTSVVILYSIIVSLEEVFKIGYVVLRLKYVRGS